ncbi:tyrosine-type recombinase/integrase, partial [Idiomarina sp. UBA1919]|uniref:tyrosine-type recombinase/integrase n=1 Tax=Idiomarina sp. UBA1919 TaxID=1946640 RepID=UPI0025810021
AELAPSRWVPLPDKAIQREIRSYIVTHRIKAQHRLFPVVTRTVQTWVAKAVKQYNETPGNRGFHFPVSCHTFRHSFAMNSCLHGVPQRVLKEWLGHQSMASTEIYLRLMQVDSYLVAEQVSWRPPLEDVEATPNEPYLLDDD